MIDQLAKQLFDDVNRVFRGDASNEGSEAGANSASQIKAIIETGLRKLDLVSREEFDAQQAVLQRTRAKLDALEQQLSDLEALAKKQAAADK